ncbi:MAG TPA: helix-turn-helix domain-containing protein [Lachnospiraceae bacterium]|nr:helix-turn-helix domain-containing protein [Lachnospiraceae bacterium]
MERISVAINQKKTGCRIRKFIFQSPYTIKDVQEAMGFHHPQSIYRWFAGETMPSLDSLLVLCVLLHVKVEDLLVMEDTGEAESENKKEFRGEDE